jgi:hypothetical protein
MTIRQITATWLLLATLTASIWAQGPTSTQAGPAPATPATIEVTGDEALQIVTRRHAHTIKEQAAQIAKLTAEKAISDFNEASAEAPKLFTAYMDYVAKVTGIPRDDLLNWSWTERDGKLLFTRLPNAPPRSVAPAQPAGAQPKP